MTEGIWVTGFHRRFNGISDGIIKNNANVMMAAEKSGAIEVGDALVAVGSKRLDMSGGSGAAGSNVAANAIRAHGFPIELTLSRPRGSGCAASTSHLLRAAEAARLHDHEDARAEFAAAAAAAAAAGGDEACPAAAVSNANDDDPPRMRSAGEGEGEGGNHNANGHRGKVVATLTTTPSRIARIGPTLESLLCQPVLETIYLHVPMVLRRDVESGAAMTIDNPESLVPETIRQLGTVTETCTFLTKHFQVRDERVNTTASPLVFHFVSSHSPRSCRESVARTASSQHCD